MLNNSIVVTCVILDSCFLNVLVICGNLNRYSDLIYTMPPIVNCLEKNYECMLSRVLNNKGSIWCTREQICGKVISLNQGILGLFVNNWAINA